MIMQFKFQSIAVIGPGVLGGSLALALSSKCVADLRLWGRRDVVLQKAKERGVNGLLTTDLEAAVAKADLAILAVPVGVMLDLWDEELARGQKRPIKIVVTNDLQTTWRGEIRLRWQQLGRRGDLGAKPITVEPYGQSEVFLEWSVPDRSGECELIAERISDAGDVVTSRRRVLVRDAPEL